MQEHYHRTIDQINSTIPIKKLHNLTLPFKKTLSFPLINIPPQRSQQTRSNTTNQKETYLIPSFNSSSPSAILFSSRVNVTIGRSPLRRGFEINLKKKKKERKKEGKKNVGWNTLGTRKLGRFRATSAKREREGEREIRFLARCGHCVCKRPMQKTTAGRSIVPVLIRAGRLTIAWQNPFGHGCTGWTWKKGGRLLIDYSWNVY